MAGASRAFAQLLQRFALLPSLAAAVSSLLPLLLSLLLHPPDHPVLELSVLLPELLGRFSPSFDAGLERLVCLREVAAGLVDDGLGLVEQAVFGPEAIRLLQ